MKITCMEQVNDFIAAVNECQGGVWLESPYGDKFDLKSQFSRYIALGALLAEHGDDLELYCTHKDDEKYFFKFFKHHPEIEI